MGKKRRCIYCGVMADTREHVPPRCLLEKPYPNNLKILPACLKCNKSFTLDEEYFLTVLASIGTVNTLKAKLEPGGIVDRAFSQSPALDDRVINSLLVAENGQVLLQPEYARIARIVQKVAYGLFILRYKKVPSMKSISPIAAYPYNIEDQRPISAFIATFTEKFQPKRWIHIQRGVFSYIVIRDSMNESRLCCIMDFHQTLWGVAYFPHPNSGKSINSFIQS